MENPGTLYWWFAGQPFPSMSHSLSIYSNTYKSMRHSLSVYCTIIFINQDHAMTQIKVILTELFSRLRFKGYLKVILHEWIVKLRFLWLNIYFYLIGISLKSLTQFFFLYEHRNKTSNFSRKHCMLHIMLCRKSQYNNVLNVLYYAPLVLK